MSDWDMKHAGGFKTGVRVEREEGSVNGTKYQLDFSWKF
jgi:hypothetical protein